MIKTLIYKGIKYPIFQAEGFAAQFAFPYAKKVCSGIGYDIGCMKKEWAFPGSIPVDISFNNGYHAMNLPHKNVDYIFSSHCLEHLDDWVRVLDYWSLNIKIGGVLFLYLPHPAQKYWLPWSDLKHIHILYPEDVKNYYYYNNFKNMFCSDRDLNHSFMIMGEKSER